MKPSGQRKVMDTVRRYPSTTVWLAFITAFTLADLIHAIVTH